MLILHIESVRIINTDTTININITIMMTVYKYIDL